MKMQVMRRFKKLAEACGLFLLLWGVNSRAQTFQRSYNFDTGTSLDDTYLYGTAKVVTDSSGAGYLSLTEATANQTGTFIIDSLTSGQLVESLTVNFHVAINQGANPADGFSVNFGPGLLNSSIGEDGADAGLVVTFDTYDNGSGDSAPAIEIVYDGEALAGATFSGRTRTNVWPLAKNSSGQTLSFNTGTSFVPVAITLAKDGTVNVTWNSTTVLANVAVPYTPVSGWRLGFGARTGSKVETHHLDNVEVSGTTLVHVVVESDYGADLVNPAVGEYNYATGDTVQFTAPPFVYLDRYKNPLEPTAENISKNAYYRARYQGVSIDGGALSHAQDDTFTVTLNSAMRVVWQWQLENLGEIGTGTADIAGLSPSDVTDAQHADKLGRHFYGPGAQDGEQFTSIVFAQVGGQDTGLPVQFAAKSYVLENAPTALDHSAVFSSGQDYMRKDGTGINWSALTNVTVEYWMRREPSSVGFGRAAVAFGSNKSGPRIWTGFAGDGNVLFGQPGVSHIEFGGYSDFEWHHWAFAYDQVAKTVGVYRDGKLVHHESNKTFDWIGMEDVVTIGGDLSQNDTSLDHPFSGGINNVRVWSTVRTADQIAQSMRTREYGVGQDNLELEVSFDSHDVEILGHGLSTQLRTPDVSQIINFSYKAVPSWILQSTTTNANVGIPAGVPSTDFGLVFNGYLQIDEATTYTFELNSDDGSGLWLDGHLVLDNDGVGGSRTNTANVSLSVGLHPIKVQYFQADRKTQLGLAYRHGSGSFAAIPDDHLFVSPPETGLFTKSSEGRDLTFEFLNFEAPFPETVQLDEQLAILFPGFEFRDVSGTGVGTVHLTDTSGSELIYHVSDWTRVTWDWEKQFQLEVMVSAPDATTLATVAKMPFISGDVVVDSAVSGTAQQISDRTVSVIKSWVPERAVVTVGTRYRTSDGCYELTDVIGQLNGFSPISMDTVVDGTFGNSVTRQYAFSSGISAPGKLVFNFGPTVFRAEIPIGEGLNVSSTAAANAQLVPDLCGTNPKLRIDKNGPTVQAVPQVSGDGVLTGGSGASYVWDFVGQKFYPLQPGLYTLTWADADDSKHAYTIEINAQFPTDKITIHNRENQNGSRQGSAPDYLTQVTYPGTAAAFPASPGAHYNYVVSANLDEPTPANMDENPSDRWAFQRLAYSERSSANVAAGNPIFTETTADVRSVLVFSYQPDSNGVANGDLSREAVAVRVVKSLDVSDSETNLSATVGSRITSSLDQADFGSGYILYDISNYNPQIHNRHAEVGLWGPIYPVNWSGLYQEDNRRLRVAYYQNPYLASPTSTLHPNVAWPYIVANYDTVNFPGTNGNMIYIASRLGSEGVNAAGADQKVFDPALYANLAIYNQPDRDQPGYNPNEEHALVAPSIKDQLTGNSSFNLGQSAAFALQNEINIYGATDSNKNSTTNVATEFTSEPCVLVQYDNLATGEKEMMAYRVEKTRKGNTLFPALDATTHLPTDTNGVPVPQPTNPTYDFIYPGFAGDPVIQPYPLNLVVGNVIMAEDQGGNVQVATNANQRTLWFDKNEQAWMVSGNGKFFYQFWYPFREDFWYDSDGDLLSDLDSGTPMAWLPTNRIFLEDIVNGPIPTKIDFNTYWRSTYPILKRGESMTYAGGEYKQEHPLAQGLPGIVGWASAEIVYDSLKPDMLYTSIASLATYSARVTRPLDAYEVDLESTNVPKELTPANQDKVMVVGERWYFKDLTGSMQKRFYYDSLRQKLVFRGRLNDLESGDPKLTAQPDGLYALEPDVMNLYDFHYAKKLSSEDQWIAAVEDLYLKSQNPNEVLDDGENPAGVSEALDPVYLSGIDSGLTKVKKTVCAYDSDYNELYCYDDFVKIYSPLKSLGVGAALVPNPTLLTATNEQPLYVTLVENNDPNVSGAVTLHIVQIGDERFRGGIKVIEPQNVFDEKINLQHTADFGGNTHSAYYQWWVRDVASLDSAGLPGENPAWQLYAQGLGLNRIEFTGRPDVVLSDKLFYVRYGERSELLALGDDPDFGGVSDSSWRLVDINDSSDSYSRTNGAPVPFQWAGAPNSPQLQADGSLDYIPQLVMGWVKRVLDRINPYEARFTDFENNDSPASYSSLLRAAGPPYVGDVALNSDKDAIENVGLIQLYETVLHRAKSLTLDIPGASTAGTDQALLLAATRLAHLYDLLASEAYSDAQNPTILVTPENGLATAAPYVFAFYNQEASLLDEELALLRGTDFVKSYPVYNRLFWNYVKGLGEAAYNANYQIGDFNVDGFIDEADAAIAYPQGHGDAWGHFLSAEKMHYELLRNSAFDWKARSEYYSLLDNVIPADYLDEKSFARIAAAKARTGKEIVADTYREAYTSDPDGQWQGYTDTADPARAWGVSEWAKRAGQGALFDWIVGNALVPDVATNSADATNLDLSSTAALDRIDRRANQDELSEIAGAFVSIQQTLDGANSGNNPLGLDRDAIAFDIDPVLFQYGSLVEKSTHFEQIYDRAKKAGQNALAALNYASQADQQLSRLTIDAGQLKKDAVRQDLDFRNRLIEIFGTPYEGTIGPGQIYPEGYDGPDTLLYLYIDRNDVADLIPSSSSDFANIDLNQTVRDYNSLDFKLVLDHSSLTSLSELFDQLYLTTPAPENELGTDLSVQIPVLRTANYAFQAPAAWGSRRSDGKIQNQLNQLLQADLDLEASLVSYDDFVTELLIQTERLNETLLRFKESQSTYRNADRAISAFNALSAALRSARHALEGQVEGAWKEARAIAAFLPRVNGLDNDVTSAARGAAMEAGVIASETFELGVKEVKILETGFGLIAEGLKLAEENDLKKVELHNELVELASEYAEKFNHEKSYRVAIAQRLQRLYSLARESQSTIAEGFRVLDERAALNKFIASSAQKDRYQDVMLRLTRNEALAKYQSAFENAARYAWLAAKAYEYETDLDPASPASASSFLEQIVKTRQLGNWANGEPQIGNGGLAEILEQLHANFQTLKGQLGINNPQFETDRLSLRYENFRILSGTNATSSSDSLWRQVLQASRVDDLWAVPEFRQYCRPLADPANGPQPGLVLEFSTDITPGLNVFGNTLTSGDHAYSTANYATKIRAAGVWLENYASLGLSSTPRVYLVPAGVDRMRLSDAQVPTIRDFNVVEQRIPVPYLINDSNLQDPNYIPSVDSLDGSFADRRRFGDFRAYDAGLTPSLDQMALTSRLIGRSVWNTRWLIIIPGASLGAAPAGALDQFIGTSTNPGITDLMVQFQTYSHEGL